MGKGNIEVSGIVMIVHMASLRLAPEQIEEFFTMALSWLSTMSERPTSAL